MAIERAEHIRHLVERGELGATVRSARDALPALEGEARGETLLLLSWARLTAGQPLDALRAAVAASDVYKACGSRAGTCEALIRVGNTLRAGGDHASVVSTLEQADELAREVGEPMLIASVMRNMGVCCSVIGRHRQALSCLNEALEISDQHGNTSDRLNARLSPYNAHNRQAEALGEGSAEAKAASSAMLGWWRSLADECAAHGHTRMEVMARGNHAITLYQCGRPAEAITELKPLLGRYRELGMKPNVAICHNELGRCHEALDEPAPAREQYVHALSLLRDGGSLDDLQQALEGLSHTEEALDNLAAALAALREVRSVDRRKSDDAARSAASQRELASNSRA